jgi:hypothetical protein
MIAPRASLDHLTVAAPTLEQGIAHVQSALVDATWRVWDRACADRPIRLIKYRVDNRIYHSRRPRLILRRGGTGVAERRIIVRLEFDFRPETLQMGALFRRELDDLCGRRGKMPRVLHNAQSQKHEGDQAQDTCRYEQEAHFLKLSNRT